SDVAYRLQASHSFWTSDPQVALNDPDLSFPIGRNGRRQIPWGIGQSLIMLPADMIISAAISPLHLPEVVEAKVRTAAVGYLIFPLVSATSVVVAALLLVRLGFSIGQSLIGSLALFFGTSLFPYTQIHQENSYLLLLDLLSLYGVLTWLRTRITSYLL